LESFKRNKYRPKQWKTTASTVVLSDFDINSGKIEKIIVAPVEENGKTYHLVGILVTKLTLRGG